jgi:hypothetical protein
LKWNDYGIPTRIYFGLDRCMQALLRRIRKRYARIWGLHLSVNP